MPRTALTAEANWQKLVAPYAKSDRSAAIRQIANTLVPFLALWPVMFYVARISYWLVLPVALLAAAFWVRTFIIFHDCCHGSFFKSRRANEITGILLGILTLTPFYEWRHAHAIHHATAGNIDKRFRGDVPTMTVREYLAGQWWMKAGYRIFRFPLFLFTVGATFMFTVIHRFPTKGAAKREVLSVVYTDLALIVLIGALGWLVGWKLFLVVALPVVVPACAAGVWMFYVQHNFAGAYWETNDRWSFIKAGLEGSSFYKLPRVLQWFTGNIGFHHIHHLSPRVPNYRLEDCYRAVPALQIKPLTIRESLKTVRLHLIDETSRQLVGWEALRGRGVSGASTA